MSYLRGIYLVARREYLAYVGAWGFWVSLITTPLFLAMIILLPVLLRHAEPTRYVAVLAERQEDSAAIRTALEQNARDATREALVAYARQAAPRAANAALAAFDAGPDLDHAIAGSRSALDQGAPGVAAGFKPPQRDYEIVLPPAPNIEELKPYLSGARPLGQGASLFAAFVVRGAGEARTLDYWSLNLTDQQPPARARDALAVLMRRDALAAHSLNAAEANRIEDLTPTFAQFDPRATQAGAEVTDRERAPFVVALGLAVLLWSSVIGVANMLLTGVLEEKSNKILDALLTSVSPLQILTGKLIGVAGVSLTLFAAWGAIAALGLTFGARLANAPPFVGALAQAALNPGVVMIFLACFAAGYLIYGAAFLGLGSICDSLQEAQTLLGPVFFLLVPPILLIGPAFENPKSPIVVGASWIPPFTPFVMLMRAPAGLSFTEAIGPLALLAVSVAAILAVAARVFSAGISHQLKLADLLRRRPKAI